MPREHAARVRHLSVILEPSAIAFDSSLTVIIRRVPRSRPAFASRRHSAPLGRRHARPRLVETMLDADNASTRARAFERGATLQPEYDSFSVLKTCAPRDACARAACARSPGLALHQRRERVVDVALRARAAQADVVARKLRHRVPVVVLDDGISVGFSVEPSGGAVLWIAERRSGTLTSACEGSWTWRWCTGKDETRGRWMMCARGRARSSWRVNSFCEA